MDFIDRLKVILEAPGDEDIDNIVDREIEPEPDEDGDVPSTASAEDGESEKSELEKLVDTEQGVIDWTGIPDPIPGKTLNDLKGVKKPLENGWTTEQVISAVKPTIIYFAKKYATPTFSVEEGIAECMTGVITALKNDKGIAPFTSHVYRYLSTSAQRGAGKASNISGVPQTKGGKYDYLAASRAAVSADAPMPGEAEETYSSQISSHYDQAGELAGKQRSMSKLIKHFLNAPSVGLSEKEKLILMALYGIGPNGETKEPKSSKDLADALQVSVVRISQLRTGAIQKIQEYVQARKFGSEEQAAQKLGLEESKLLAIAKSLLTIISESINIEIEMYSKHQIVEVKSNYRGLNESVKIHVNSDTFEVDNAIDENNESVLGIIEKPLMVEAINIAKAKSSRRYFVEMINNVIGMQAQPVLATINNSLSVSQIPFRFLRTKGVEKAMGDAEHKIFGKRNLDDAIYENNGSAKEVIWWYPVKYRAEIEKMRDIMNRKGFVMKESVVREGIEAGDYQTELSAPYLDGSGNTSYRVIFSLYGYGLDSLDIIRIDDIDTGENNVDLTTVNLDAIEKAVNEKIRTGEINKLEENHPEDEENIRYGNEEGKIR